MWCKGIVDAVSGILAEGKRNLDTRVKVWVLMTINNIWVYMPFSSFKFETSGLQESLRIARKCENKKELLQLCFCHSALPLVAVQNIEAYDTMAVF